MMRSLRLRNGLGVFLGLLCWAAWAQTPVVDRSPAAVAAAAAANVPAEAFFKNRDVLDAQLSPSGTQLALTTAAGVKRVALAVVDLAPGGKAVRVAHFIDVDVVEFSWVNNNRLIFSVADLESGSGEDRRSAPGLYGVDADGKNLRQLVARGSEPIVVEGRITRDVLPYNHVLLKVPLPEFGVEADEVLVGRLIFDVNNDISEVLPLRLNTRNGRTRLMDLDAPRGTVGWLFDSAGEARVAVARRQGQQLIHWRGPGQTAWQLLNQADSLRAPFIPHHVDDAGNLYVTQRRGPQGYGELVQYDFDRREPAQAAWISTPGFDYSGTVLVTRRGGSAAGVRVVTDAEQTVWFDPKMKAFQALVDERLSGTVNRISCRRCGEPNMVALVRQFSDRHPGQLWVYTAADQRWLGVAQVNAGIDPRLMASVDFQRIKARDGRDLPVWLTLPIGRQAGRPGPAVVLVHGGPWVRGGHWKWSETEQFLASRGYLVISPEFRGSQGYGQAHFEAGWKQWGRAMQDDVADAVLWAQAQGLADKRVCIAGASYGGYSTLMGLVRHPELYRCGVAWVAVTDPFLYLEGSWWISDDISRSGRRYSLPQMVGDAKADADMLTSVSPLAQADRILAPLLLAFGEADQRVPLAHGKRLRDALQKAGRDPLWVVYADEGHSWRLPQTRADFARRMERFLAEHLK
jgi:dipeptidyl aminopeptidase/acylaminoacyl peptidase